jgi:hypothetical protein
LWNDSEEAGNCSSECEELESNGCEAGHYKNNQGGDKSHRLDEAHGIWYVLYINSIKLIIISFSADVFYYRVLFKSGEYTFLWQTYIITGSY